MFWCKCHKFFDPRLKQWDCQIIPFNFIKPALDIPEHWFLGISPEGIGTVGMVLNFVVAIVVSIFTPPPPEEVQAMVEEIRVP